MKLKQIALTAGIAVLAMGSIVHADTFTGSGTGHGGDVPVTVVYEDGQITDIQVGENSETDGIGTIAIEQLPGTIVEAQSLDVDAVTGATETSSAILAAVEAALTDNGIDTASFHGDKKEEALEEGEAEETDVVIVGAGLSGLMAAYELKENYPDVDYIIIEKLGMVGGSIPGTGGCMAAVSSKYHEADGTQSTPSDFVDLFKFTSNAEVNEQLVLNVYEESDVLLNRLLDAGAPFEEGTGQTSKYNDKVFYLQTELKEGAKVRGASFGEFLSDYVEKDPINIRMNTKATGLIVEEGQVKGITAEDKEKKYEIHASAVLLATGGFGSSREMMEKYLPIHADDFMSTNGGATGDGINMVEEYFDVAVIGDGSMGSIVAPDGTPLIASNFMVNTAGARFIGEQEPKYVLQRAVAEQEGKTAFLIVDSTYEDKATLEDNISKGYVKEYATLTELAQDNGIDADALAATAADYTEKAAAGEEIEALEFALAAEAATPLDTAPYYVEKVTVRTFGTLPGLEINENCQIITTDGEAVPGLYASGELVAGNAFTRQYPGIGIGISFAGNSGRYAIKQIAENIG